MCLSEPAHHSAINRAVVVNLSVLTGETESAVSGRSLEGVELLRGGVSCSGAIRGAVLLPGSEVCGKRGARGVRYSSHPR